MQVSKVAPREYKTKIEPFEFQNWEVYRKSIRLVKGCKELSIQSKDIGIKGFSDQLTRAALSISLNIAEGISRYGVKEKMNYLRIAKGSLFECVSCFDVLRSVEGIDLKAYQEYIQVSVEIGKMLSGLIRSIEERGAAKG